MEFLTVVRSKWTVYCQQMVGVCLCFCVFVCTYVHVCMCVRVFVHSFILPDVVVIPHGFLHILQWNYVVA